MIGMYERKTKEKMNMHVNYIREKEKMNSSPKKLRNIRKTIEKVSMRL